MNQLLNQVIDVTVKAGEAIMAIYDTDFAQFEKQDSSPLTEADLASHRMIIDGLSNFSDLPVLSEESSEAEMDWDIRGQWQKYWLIDPLDGTKEFIHKNGEFTVNIALIENGKAILGVVYCPAIGRLYYGAQGIGAYKVENGQQASPIQVAANPIDKQSWKIVGSRRHGIETLNQFASALGDVEPVSMGSSLKLCLVAEGAAHLYPRLAPTCEWDTAAAQAIVEQAGGQVLKPDLSPLEYGRKQELLNPFFIVCNRADERWTRTFTELSN
ncbi:MAG: 3'(2'),5'-bisphosphate nucleotidase CysQ [Shewanella sp.]|nr:3'(2'),5'-bisphosphate nucleotidase CysQ [Shewanella sp.]